MKTCCIVVIGHVDHGKTSLTHALTGIDTDRLTEEKARGLSIVPGFAHRAYPGGVVDFIDAPGHEDFVQAMISGAAGAQAALVVVSASEGVGAQTLEHLAIAGLLGITRGVIAVTKSDLLAPPELAARIDALRAALAHTPLADAPMVPCSARTGDGIDDLHASLQTVLAQATGADGPLQTVLPIDRAFSLPGRGTIVTGTLLGGDLTVGAEVVLQPTGKTVAVRSLQSRGADRDRVSAGERVAVNLRGVAVPDVARGAALCVKGAGAPSGCIDVLLQVQSTASRALKHMETVRVSFGTSAVVATVRVFGGGQIAAGASAFAQIRFKDPLFGYAGQRAVLRRLSPPETIAGAVFLDPQAGPTRSGDSARVQVLEAAQTRDPVAIANALCAANQGVASLRDIGCLSRASTRTVRAALCNTFVDLDADLIAAAGGVDACKDDMLACVRAYHVKYPLRTMVPRANLTLAPVSPAMLEYAEASLCAEGKLYRRDNSIAICGHDPLALLTNDQRGRLHAVEDAYRARTLSPPSSDDLVESKLDQELTALLLEVGSLVSLRNVSLKQTLIFHFDALAGAAATLSAAFPAPQSFTTSQARAALATTRRIIVPVLEYFDSRGVTIREADARRMTGANLVSQSRPTC